MLLPTGTRSLASCSSPRLTRTRTSQCGSAERASIPRRSHATRKLAVEGSRLNRGRVVVNEWYHPVCKGEGQHESGERAEWFVTSSHPSHGCRCRRAGSGEPVTVGLVSGSCPYLPPDTTGDNTPGPLTRRPTPWMPATVVRTMVGVYIIMCWARGTQAAHFRRGTDSIGDLCRQ